MASSLQVRYPKRPEEEEINLKSQMTYSLDRPDTSNAAEVETAIREIFEHHFPEDSSGFVNEYFADVNEMFDGNYLHFGPVTTEYHNCEHTFQAVLCLARLLEGRKLSGDKPALTATHFRIGIVASLLHDTGYLKEKTDLSGTGAKHTLQHELRSASMARVYLGNKGWEESEVKSVEHVVLCTGPRSQLDNLEFSGPMEKFLARAVCTSDYLGQMADRHYFEKLPLLFREFKESDDYQGVPMEKRMFPTEKSLIAKTPSFWEYVKNKILDDRCGGVHNYLRRPIGVEDAHHPYLEKVEQNIDRIKRLIEEKEIS